MMFASRKGNEMAEAHARAAPAPRNEPLETWTSVQPVFQLSVVAWHFFFFFFY